MIVGLLLEMATGDENMPKGGHQDDLSRLAATDEKHIWSWGLAPRGSASAATTASARTNSYTHTRTQTALDGRQTSLTRHDSSPSSKDESRGLPQKRTIRIARNGRV